MDVGSARRYVSLCLPGLIPVQNLNNMKPASEKSPAGFDVCARSPKPAVEITNRNPRPRSECLSLSVLKATGDMDRKPGPIVVNLASRSEYE